MKKIAFLLLSILIIASCKKETSTEPTAPTPSDSLPSAFIKRVLLEDYSKHCQFCIPLNSVVDSMRHAYPNNSFIPVIVSLNHASQIPYFDSISQFFTVTSTPTGSVNRVPAVNSSSQNGKLVYTKDYWATNIDVEVAKSTDFGLKLNSSLSGSSLNLTVKVGSFISSSDLKLTVFIIENDLLYRTLRKVVTHYKGDDLNLQENEILSRDYNSIDLSGLNLSKTSVVAFVHYFDEVSQNFKIENAQEVKVGESVSW